MKIDILSLFPFMFDNFLNTSIIKRAIEKKKVFINIINFRDYSKDPHKKVDDTPYGGGAGMVIMPDVVYRAYNSIDNIEKDFVDMPPAFAAYIRLHSFQKKQSRISARINKYKKYYEKPCELFARLVEGIYLDREWVEAIAPNLIKQFYDLLKDGYYMELEVVLSTFLHKKLPLSAQSI